MTALAALGKLLDSLPPNFPNRAYYDEICAQEQSMKPRPSDAPPTLPTTGSGVKPAKFHEDTPPPAFGDNMTAVHAKLAGATSVRGLQHISDTAACALRKAISQLEHVRVFASSGHSIHPTGLELFDADVGFIKRSLVAIEQYRAEQGKFVPVIESDQRKLDDVVHVLGIEDSEDDPSEVCKQIMDERDRLLEAVWRVRNGIVTEDAAVAANILTNAGIKS